MADSNPKLPAKVASSPPPPPHNDNTTNNSDMNISVITSNNSEESSDLLNSEAGTTCVETRDGDFSLIHPTFDYLNAHFTKPQLQDHCRNLEGGRNTSMSFRRENVNTTADNQPHNCQPSHHVPSQDSHPEHHNTATTSTSLGRASGKYYSPGIGSESAAQLKGGHRQVIPTPASPQVPMPPPPTPTLLTTTTAGSRHHHHHHHHHPPHDGPTYAPPPHNHWREARGRRLRSSQISPLLPTSQRLQLPQETPGGVTGGKLPTPPSQSPPPPPSLRYE
ncbi:hypothetical protein Pmani_024034 [Petrolisthes manimaculis]|uniref:Uncharacterized protein n=1 Tax=Petrolisthes manimaculis TaxID=1843537 RepID=A0AAE1PAL7_9EUCA|nr:hypothetical protein Pmani_024034 [Petrolisthes manimaculis]